MRIAVLGVGLIGGSIGLAAKRRLGAEVRGFDPDPAARERGARARRRSTGWTTRSPRRSTAPSLSSARRPLGLFRGLVGRGARRRAASKAAITDYDVNQGAPWARRWGGPQSERFIGGHPLAGAETAGVEYARADLSRGRAGT